MLKISKELIDAFVEGTQKTLSVQCGLETTSRKPYLKGTQPEPKIALTGIVVMVSTQFSGIVHLSFTESSFLAIMDKMLGEEFSQISDELTSGAAELLNIIYGSAKVILNQQGYAIKAAIPTVVRGDAIQTKSVTTNPALVLPFSTEFGDFFLEIAEEFGDQKATKTLDQPPQK